MPLSIPPTGSTTFVGAKAYADATQTLSAGVLTAITFNLEEYDSDAFHDTSSNTSRMTIPSGKAGKYRLSGGTFFSNSSDFIGFRSNGSTTLRGYQSTQTSSAGYRSASIEVALSVGEYVELIAQSSGGCNVGHASLLDAQSWFSIAFLGS